MRGQRNKDKRVADNSTVLRERCLKLLSSNGWQTTLEYAANLLNQPKEPLKEVLAEVCTFDKQSKTYKTKNEYRCE